MNPGTGGVIQPRPPPAERLHLACRRKRVERALHSALTRSQRAPGPSSTMTRRPRARRAPPRPLLRWATPARRHCVHGAAPARNPASSRARRPAFEAARSRPTSTRSRARCDHRRARSERPRDEHLSARPPATLAQRACEREQHRTGERDDLALVTDDMTACVHDERIDQHRLDLLEQEKALLPTRKQARRGSVHDEACARPPLSAQGCGRAAPRARPGQGPRAPPSSGGRRIAIPATTSSWAVLDAGGKGRGRACRAPPRPRRCPIRTRR